MSSVVGIDVGGTNTDAVILRNGRVIAWHKTLTTPDVQTGVETAIEEVVRKGGIAFDEVSAVKIGTTQFVNAVLQEDVKKLDKVAVIRLCGPYSRGSPPFAGFPPGLRDLVQGHYGYVDGGYQVDGASISPLNHDQLEEQVSLIKQKSIKSVVVVGIYSPSNPEQELEAASFLSSKMGSGYDVSCSHKTGRLGFLERENASILNGSLRRFARQIISGYAHAVKRFGKCRLYITLNDGTLSAASEAAQYPVLCFRSGPTNSARGAAFLAELNVGKDADNKEVLIMDVGGTTTDICALTTNGFPRQSAAFVKIAGVRTSFTIPDVYSVALGGGSVVREKEERTTVGPDSVGSQLTTESIHFGGLTLTTTDLVLSNDFTQAISPNVKTLGLLEVKRAVEEAIDRVKTKQGGAILILVGGGSIIVDENIVGVDRLIRPKYFDVANAVGAAIAKISGWADVVAVPEHKSIAEQLEEAKVLAIDRCVASGGNRETAEIVEIDVVPLSYVTNGATRLMVRVISDLSESWVRSNDDDEDDLHIFDTSPTPASIEYCEGVSWSRPSNQIIEHYDVESYEPDIQKDLWYLSEFDLQLLQDGTGILGVGSCGEPYPTYIACLEELRSGKPLIIRRQASISEEDVVLVSGFMGSPSVYLERIPGKNEAIDAMKAVMDASGLASFAAVIPNEIGGMNAFEALLAASRLGKCTLDTDCVARAYPFLWQTVRCLEDISITPAAVADGAGKTEVLDFSHDKFHAEKVLRDACTELGSLSGVCVNPIRGTEARNLPRNSFSYAWTIGRSIALSRSRKEDPVTNLVQQHNGTHLFTGKITSVSRNVSKGFTRGSVLLASTGDDDSSSSNSTNSSSQVAELLVEFENENLCALLKRHGEEDKTLACCPDLISFLDRSNGAPLGISDYKYGLRVSVVALRAPPIWATEKGLKIGGLKAFGLDVKYVPVGTDVYKPPQSVWDMFHKEPSEKDQ